MKRSRFWIVVLLLALVVQTTVGVIATDPFARGLAAEAPLVYTEPLGIGMESYPYPYPVKFLPLTIENQLVRMAYMDVPLIYQQPVRHEFSLITTPTLLVNGQEDRTALGRNFVTPEVRATLGQYPQLGKAAAKDIPNSKLVELQKVGHIPHLEAPDIFHQALLNFLK